MWIRILTAFLLINIFGMECDEVMERKKFQDTDCFDEDDLSGYRGIKQKTVNGWKCQMWKRNKPWRHSFKQKNYPNAGLQRNYCRNPDNDTEPWCFTMKTQLSKQWDYCGVERCEEIETTRAPLNQTCGLPDIISASAKQIKSIGFIVGGVESIPGSIPWQVSLQRKLDNDHWCGGAIISTTFILTAAHCVYWDQTPSNYYIVAGEHTLDTYESAEQKYNLVQIILHEDYDDDNLENDIALLQTSEEMTFTDYIQAICLPEEGSIPSAGDTVTVSGWGTTLQNSNPVSNVLREVTIPVVELSKCANKLGAFNPVTSKMVCAGVWSGGGKDSCQGDSGGPLFAANSDEQYEVIGIVSWGVGCGKSKKPGVYTRVSAYIDWIWNLIDSS